MRSYMIVALACFYATLVVVGLSIYRWYRDLPKRERVVLDQEIGPW